MILREDNQDDSSEFKRYSAADKLIDAAYFLRQLLSLGNLGHHRRSFPRVPLSGSGLEDDSSTLSNLFNLYGSDKSTHHDYHLLYSSLLGQRRHGIKRIVEIGIGSNDLQTPQNMGAEGHPGASLRAFRDWAPNAEVVGADIDSKTLFTEERISTCVVNQLERKSFFSLKELISQGADLIVIDGLHTPRADMNSLLELLPSLSSEGCFVIEDISPRAARLLWPLAQMVLRKKYLVTIRQMKNGYLFVVLAGK